MAESFKQEEIYASQYRNIDHLRSAIVEFIDTVYNKASLHSALGYRPPDGYEAIMESSKQLAIEAAAQAHEARP